MTISSHSCANPACAMPLLRPRAVDHDDLPPEPSDIIVCGACYTVNVVTDHGTRVLSDEEFLKLSPEERSDLSFIARNIK